jgi:hypothetical protein
LCSVCEKNSIIVEDGSEKCELEYVDTNVSWIQNFMDIDLPHGVLLLTLKKFLKICNSQSS